MAKGCDTPAQRRGWCHAHYRRVRLHGSPLEDKPIRPLRPRGLSLEDSFKWWMPDNPPVEGCWEWTGRRDDNGYGWLKFHGRDLGAHVASHLIHKGDVGTLFVLHSCDNPPCCNPAHLWLGTQADNMADMSGKGRGRNQGQRREKVMCSVESCNRKASARGWCLPHWKRWRRYGDPLLGRKSPIVCLPEHVVGVEVDEPDVSGYRTGG